MNYFFCGIGGIGMSSIALCLASNPANEVFGSDRAFDQNEKKDIYDLLIKAGIQIYPQDGSGINDKTECLVISSAIETSVPEVRKAKKQGIKICTRAEVLAEILSHHIGVAIGGTSGKSTITAMVGHILKMQGKAPTMINGAVSVNRYDNNPASNFMLGEGKICVIEADESDGSIEFYRPQVAVLSTVSLDHKPLKELKELFQDFLFHASRGVVLNADCREMKPLLKIHPNTITYSKRRGSKATIVASNIRLGKTLTRFTVNGVPASMHVLGLHNVQNALAAIGACVWLGLSIEEAVEGLKTFKGVKRRLETIESIGGIHIYDDYAHNPEKVEATLSTLSTLAGKKGRVFAIFQPHGFAPTKLMEKEYVKAFSTATGKKDILLFLDILYKGGTVKKDISSNDLVEQIRKNHLRTFYLPQREDIVPFVVPYLQSGDSVVVMGARDPSLTDLAQDIAKALQKRLAKC